MVFCRLRNARRAVGDRCRLKNALRWAAIFFLKETSAFFALAHDAACDSAVGAATGLEGLPLAPPASTNAQVTTASNSIPRSAHRFPGRFTR